MCKRVPKRMSECGIIKNPTNTHAGDLENIKKNASGVSGYIEFITT